MAKDFEKAAQTFRRKFGELAANITLIKDWGRKASSEPTDKENVAFFRGMLQNLESSYAKYDDLWQEFEALQDEGAENIPSTADLENRKQTRNNYFVANKYSQLLQMHAEEVARSRDVTMMGTTMGESKIARSLPKLHLPTFDGTHTQWPSYRDTFVSLVESDVTMPDVSKLHYLRSSLTGPAFSLINHLQISDANYPIAWKVIMDTYNNKRFLASTYLDKILSAKPPAGKGTPDSLKVFLANVGDSVAGLKLLNIQNQDGYILFYLAVRALDPVTRELFETSRKGEEFPTVDSLIEFARERSKSLLLATTGSTSTSNAQPVRAIRQPKPPQPRNFTKTVLLAQDQKACKKASTQVRHQHVEKAPPRSNSPMASKTPPCFICKVANHHLLSCEKFHLASAEDKWKLIAGWNGCINCLNPNHTVPSCPSSWRCRFCPERHHSALHRTHTPRASCTSSSSDQSNSLSAVSQEEGQIILGTALVELLDARGKFQTVRAVIDSGSQNSFISLKCLNRLGLTMCSLRKRISGIGQTPFEGTKGKTTCILRPRSQQSFQLRSETIVVSNITSYLPARSLSAKFVERCSGYELADPEFWKSSPIDFLLGADLFPQVMTGRVVPIEGSQAKLFSSLFGYVVLGKIESSSGDSAVSLFTLASDDDLNTQLKKFWEIEEPLPSHVFRNPEDEICEEHFKRTHTRTAEGKYVVRLPFKENPPLVGDSSHIARKRFLNLEKKLNSNPNLKTGYHEIIREYLELDHLAPAQSPTKFVIPHHCVSKEDKGSVSLRVVFDASVPVSNGSLNSHLLVGEKLQRDIRDVILSYRQHPVVFSADIIKMFRMILVDRRDRNFLQIFWRFTPDEEIQRFELKTLPFGLVSSPFLALRVLKQLCQDHGADHPLAAQVLQKDIYVDDVLTGAPSEAEALELKHQLVNLLLKGGFRLSKWVSNSKLILDSVREGTVKSIVSLSDKEDTWVKLLGLQWDPVDDAFLFSLQPPHPVYTKRGILSAVARLYDPVGFLSPVTMLMKGIVQDLWKLGAHWDDAIPDTIKTLWDVILSELHYLSTIRIPRFLLTSNQSERHIVGFSDASTKGYAAVLYLRVLIPGQGWHVSFLSSKSRLAPTAAMSTPRLELSGAVLLTQLYGAHQDFIDSLSGPVHPPTFHTDSSIVLAWLRTPTYKLQTFVANRVAKVQEMTTPNTWRHVSSEENPSDVASRGVFPSMLPKDKLWWTGPSWLTLNQADWPSPSFSVDSDIPELKPSCQTLISSSHESPWSSWMEGFSSFLKVVRIIAWVRRWIHNVKHAECCCCPLRSGPLQLFELELATEACVRWVQDHHLFQGRPFSCVAQKYAKLLPFKDTKGIVRVGGRLRKANLSDAQKFPILLPADAHLTKLMVDHYHRSYLHPGPNLLQAIIQKIYWVPALRRLIRSRGFKCNTCYRMRAIPITPLMGDLPTYRVNGGRAFLHVGVDFAGPFRMKESSRRNAAVGKVYLCLFVCMSTKALHLEAVTRLTTDAFIAALERFTSRRGLPSDMYSDRGSNFIGAAHYLSELRYWFRSQQTETDVMNHAAKLHINWHFNPPLTPHMGGIWEAGVKSVKGHLSKVVGEQVLTYEELSTLFYKIEAILNSRPLCPLSSSPEETDYLSPAHFLVGSPLVTVPQPSLLDLKENLLDRWQLVYLLGQRFWKRWRTEYLSTLQSRPKWMQRTDNLQVGDIVLLKEDSSPLSWPIAKVLEVKPGEDGVVRVATIRTAKAVYQRPVVRLIPLIPIHNPVSPETSNQ